MIYVRLAGGLGNQLYQLAAAEFFAKKFSTRFTPVLGGLSRYAVSRAPDSLSVFSSDRLVVGSNSAIREFLSDRLRLGRWAPIKGINDQNFANFSGRHECAVGDLYLDGYFQDCWDRSSFDLAMSEVRISPLMDHRSKEDAGLFCALHIRGGDFLKIPIHQVVGCEYYFRCVRAALDAGFEEFRVVTDDPVFASHVVSRISREINGFHFKMRAGESALDDFYFLRDAPCRIIGNSTFAWWAAALDANRSPTWSPDKFITSKTRNFFLPWEKVLNAS